MPSRARRTPPLPRHRRTATTPPRGPPARAPPRAPCGRPPPSFERRLEVMRRDAQAGVEVEPVRVLALGPDPGVEVELRAALPAALLLAPLEQRAAVPSAARLGQRRE